MEKQPSHGVVVINSAHWIFIISVMVFILTLYSYVPPLVEVAQILLIATLFTFSVLWYWRNGSAIAYCLTFVPVLTINSLLAQMSLWQCLALISGIFSLYLWGLKTYLLMLLTDIDAV
jgi:hypothetical protein